MSDTLLVSSSHTSLHQLIYYLQHFGLYIPKAMRLIDSFMPEALIRNIDDTAFSSFINTMLYQVVLLILLLAVGIILTIVHCVLVAYKIKL